MKAKKVLTTLAIIGTIAVPFSVFAATSDTNTAKTVRGFFGIDTSKLTDTQKADVTDYTKKMADLQKSFVNKMVENGSMTKEQGEAAIQRIENAAANGDLSKGLFGGRFHDGGRRGGFGLFGVDISKLTDEQKADLTESFKKMADLQKELINKEVASGLITKEQGDAAIQRIDDCIKNEDFPMGMKMGGFGGLGINRVDPDKLTDQQKADLEDFSKKMADIHKELINKMVANGSMTREQGDAAVQRMNDMVERKKEARFPKDFDGKGMGKGKRGFAGQKRMNSFNAESNTAPTE